MNPIGIILSFLYPFFFVDPTASKAEIKKALNLYLLSFVIISSFWLIITILFYKEPKTLKKSKENQNVNPQNC
jgi:hypothetical protein